MKIFTVVRLLKQMPSKFMHQILGTPLVLGTIQVYLLAFPRSPPLPSPSILICLLTAAMVTLRRTILICLLTSAMVTLRRTNESLDVMDYFEVRSTNCFDFIKPFV
ncbi:hypothetical protein ACOSP7_029178 [Xanthoceras sorbifolium]